MFTLKCRGTAVPRKEFSITFDTESNTWRAIERPPLVMFRTNTGGAYHRNPHGGVVLTKYDQPAMIIVNIDDLRLGEVEIGLAGTRGHVQETAQPFGWIVESVEE